MSDPTTPLPFQPATMTTAHLAAVSYLARYSGRTHTLYAYQLRQWLEWCQSTGLDPLDGIQRPRRAVHPRSRRPLMDSSVNTMMHAVRGYFRFAHIDGLIGSDPAVYARLPKVHRDESCTQGLDRLELIRFLQIAQTLTVQPRARPHVLCRVLRRLQQSSSPRRAWTLDAERRAHQPSRDRPGCPRRRPERRPRSAHQPVQSPAAAPTATRTRLDQPAREL
jgi:hypothetical protein